MPKSSYVKIPVETPLNKCIRIFIITPYCQYKQYKALLRGVSTVSYGGIEFEPFSAGIKDCYLS